MSAKFLLLFFLAAPAIAQEPTKKIAPADPVSVTAHEPIANVFETGDPAKAAPVIQPVPLPPLKKPLGTVARELRVQHSADPKATTVRDDETPIVPEEKQ